MRRRYFTKRVLMLASVASMIDQFNMSNIRILLEMGYEVHVACNFAEGNTCDEMQVRKFRRRLRAMHVRYHQWDCPRNAYEAGKCLKAFVQLCRLAERYGFLWIHCHSPAGGMLARLAARGKKVRVIYTAHGFHFYRGAPLTNWLVYYPVEKLLSYWTDVLITVNKEDYRFAKRNLKAGRVCRIPGVGVDTERFQENREDGTHIPAEEARKKFCRKYRIPENALILLSVGELSRRKNHQAVITALAGLQRRDLYYLICGQGKMESRLKAQAQDLGVACRIRMTGFRADVVQFYRNADIFVFPSLQEGLPAALMEAMAAGRACAVSDIRGNRELIDDAGGIRFPPDRPQLLAEALEKLAGDKERRQMCGMHNRQKIKKYCQEAADCRMKKIYALMDKACGAPDQMRQSGQRPRRMAER